MATELTRTRAQGLLIPDPELELWEAESSYTQADPRPGVPQPVSSSNMTLVSSGTQDAGGHVNVRTQVGGLPAGGSATFAWKNESDSASSWRGWDVPHLFSEFEAVEWTDGTATTVSAVKPHAISLPDGKVMCAVGVQDSSGGTTYGVRVYVRSTAGVWSSVDVWSETSSPALYGDYHPSLVMLPSGRILLYFWRFDYDAVFAQIVCYQSDDDGSTWTLAQEACLPAPISCGFSGSDILVRRIRAVYGNGQVLLVMQGRRDTATNERDTYRQYASRDEGMNFSLVEEWPDTAGVGGGAHDLVFVDGTFVFTYIDTSDAYARCIRIGSAYEPLQGAEKITISGSALGTLSAQLVTNSEVACAVDEDGALYVYALASTPTTGPAYRSLDGGRTWDDMKPSGNVSWWAGQDASSTPRAFCAVASQGRVVVLSNMAANPGNEDNSLVAMYLGGWTTRPQPGGYRFKGRSDPQEWEITWMPVDEPDDMAWTYGGTSGTPVLQDGHLDIGPTSSTAYYTDTLLGISTRPGIVAEFDTRWGAGGSSLTDDYYVEVIAADGGTADYKVGIRIYQTGFRVRDVYGASTLHTESVDLDTGITSFRIELAAGNVSVWYRTEINGDADRAWVLAYTGSGVTNNLGSVSNCQVLWGQFAGTSSVQSDWFRVCAARVVADTPARSNPDDLPGRPLTTRPTHVSGGLKVRGADGSTAAGDEWDIQTRYGYEITRATDGRRLSPRIAWHATGTNQEEIAFRWSDQGARLAGNDLYGIYLGNINAARLQVYGYRSSSWNLLATTVLDRVVSFQRDGSSVQPDSSSPEKPYVYMNELAGDWFSFTSSGGDGRRIVANTEGKWDSAHRKRANVFLEGMDGTEPSSGSTGGLMPSNVVILLPMNATTYEGIKIRITSAASSGRPPPESYYRVGTIVMGPVLVHGDETSWGRVIDIEQSVDLQTFEDGSSRSRVLAPDRRTIEYGWTDAVDTTTATDPDGDPDPDFYELHDNASALGVAAVGDTPFQLEGALRWLRGADRPVVYLPRIPHLGSAAARTLDRRHQFMLGRLTSPVRIETVHGEELEDEVMRVATLTIREEV